MNSAWNVAVHTVLVRHYNEEKIEIYDVNLICIRLTIGIVKMMLDDHLNFKLFLFSNQVLQNQLKFNLWIQYSELPLRIMKNSKFQIAKIYVPDSLYKLTYLKHCLPWQSVCFVHCRLFFRSLIHCGRDR